MRFSKPLYFLAASLLLLPSIVTAQEGGAEGGQSVAESSVSGDAQAAKAEFQKRFDAWKEAIKQIEMLRIEYQTADAARRQELQQELQAKYEAANAQVSGVIEAAVTAFTTGGGKDEELQHFLLAVTDQRMDADRYEEAIPIIDALTAAGVDNPALPLFGVTASFALADYDAAKKHLERAEEAGILAQPPAADNSTFAELWHSVIGVRAVLDKHEEAWEKEQAIRAAEADADDLPRVLFKTTKGDITLELFENEAPNTVKNFITLTEQGSYDGTAFHRVLPNFMAQGGDPTTAGKPGPAYLIPCECYEQNARKHFRGSLSMAHAGRDTGNAQFFLTFRPTPHLDGQTFYPGSPNAAHTVFGRVIDGINVLAEITRVDPQTDQPQPEPDRIIEATVLRKRPGTDYSDFQKLTR